jgi:hypothetical protein
VGTRLDPLGDFRLDRLRQHLLGASTKQQRKRIARRRHWHDESIYGSFWHGGAPLGLRVLRQANYPKGRRPFQDLIHNFWLYLDYFAKGPSAKLGILTNGVHWRFFTDLEHDNIMDKKPFVEWQIISDEPVPWDFLNLLQKSKHSSELIRTFAERQRKQNLLVEELARLLEPAPEFVRLAVEKIETRNLTAAVVENWKPVLKAAINEWAKQQRLSSALSSPISNERVTSGETKQSKAVETTQAELDGFAAVQKLLGADRPTEYVDTASYFKIHIPGRPFYAVCRLFNFGEKNSSIQIALPIETMQPMVPTLTISAPAAGWTRITGGIDELGSLREALRLAWDQRNVAVTGGDPQVE